MEDAILDTMLFLEDLDFMVVFRLFGLGLFVFWLVVVGWAAIDATERLESKWMRLLAVLLVILLPLFGLLIYLTVRPRETREEAKWTNAERRYLKFETAGLYDCPSCGYEVFPNHIFCPRCGYELRFKCESCEVYLESEWNTCPYCGEEQSRVKPLIFTHVHPDITERPEEESEVQDIPAAEPYPAGLNEVKPRSRPRRRVFLGASFRKNTEKKEELMKSEEIEQAKDIEDVEAEKSDEYKKESDSETVKPKRKDSFWLRVRRGWKAILGRTDEVVQKVGGIPLSIVDRRKKLDKDDE
jgi:ribosomal protein L32